MGIPRNSREMALFGQGIPMGIPLIPDLGNSRSGNSTSLVGVSMSVYLTGGRQPLVKRKTVPGCYTRILSFNFGSLCLNGPLTQLHQ